MLDSHWSICINQSHRSKFGQHTGGDEITKSTQLFRVVRLYHIINQKTSFVNLAIPLRGSSMKSSRRCPQQSLRWNGFFVQYFIFHFYTDTHVWEPQFYIMPPLSSHPHPLDPALCLVFLEASAGYHYGCRALPLAGSRCELRWRIISLVLRRAWLRGPP